MSELKKPGAIPVQEFELSVLGRSKRNLDLEKGMVLSVL
jgi:hypothetical protein